MTLTKISWYLPNIGTDAIDSIGAGQYGSVDAYSLVSNDRRFWIEPDCDGDDHLCTVAQPGMKIPLIYNGISTVNAKPFTLIEDINAYGGGHPVYVPKPTK